MFEFSIIGDNLTSVAPKCTCKRARTEPQLPDKNSFQKRTKNKKTNEAEADVFHEWHDENLNMGTASPPAKKKGKWDCISCLLVKMFIDFSVQNQLQKQPSLNNASQQQ